MDTIKSSADISYLFSHGKRIHTPFLTILVIPRQHGCSPRLSGRVAFIAGKKNGNAVWRNAAKRRMREICRELGGPWDDCSVIFLAKRGIETASYSRVLAACEKAIERSGAIRLTSHE